MGDKPVDVLFSNLAQDPLADPNKTASCKASDVAKNNELSNAAERIHRQNAKKKVKKVVV